MAGLVSSLGNSSYGATKLPGKLDAVMLTTGKDTRVFEKSIASALTRLVDIDQFFVISPSAEELQQRLGSKLGSRVVFVNERIFPFDGANISTVMIESVRQKGVYPLEDGKSQFEKTIWGRIGW
jgi:hypothetical protein